MEQTGEATMTTETPPDDWVLLEAAKQAETWCGSIEWLRGLYNASGSFRALCDMIAKHEKPPVDRKVLCAREAVRNAGFVIDHADIESIAVRAIELWEEGFGK
jgi:hypothetical protein